MREREAEFVVHRIQLALDAWTHSLAATADLAATMEAS
jgi:hypothetical protein